MESKPYILTDLVAGYLRVELDSEAVNRTNFFLRSDLILRSDLNERPEKSEEWATSADERREIANYLAIPLKDSTQEQLVDFSIYSPDLVGPDSSFILDVWANLPVQRDEMLERASKRNRKVEVGSRSGIGVPWQIGLSLILRLVFRPI